MTGMKAITQERYGLPEVLELRDVERPIPGEGEVLIAVEAASLNSWDWHMTTGTPFMARTQAGLRTPKHPIPGADVAGVVEAVGEGVTRFAPGDEVFGTIGHGAFAEYVAVPEDRLVAKPTSVSSEQAAATPLAALTALEALRDIAAVEPGQRVLVNGGSGGVGTFAIQIAKALGAAVTAVVSTSKVELARSIGADRVIDYTIEDFVETERGYDVLFDNVGDRPWSQTRKVLTSGGINVATTGPKHAVMGPFRSQVFRQILASFGSQRYRWFFAAARPQDLETVAELLAARDVVPVIENSYPLEKTPDALRYLGEGHALGKLVITM